MNSDNHKSFTDMTEKSWAIPFVEHMQSRNVIGGYPDGTFKPNQPVTRAEAVKMTMYELGVTSGESDMPFNDVTQIPEWCKSTLQAALDQNIIQPSDGQTFNAQQPATRAWVALMAARMLGAQEPAQPVDASKLAYKDAAGIPQDLLWCVDYATEMDIFHGYPDGTFQPNKPITRAEMAAIMCKLDLMMNGETVGVIEAVDETSLTVSGSVYDLADTVYVYIDNQPAQVSDLQPGLSIQVDVDASGNVVMIEAYSNTPAGSTSAGGGTAANSTATGSTNAANDSATDSTTTGDTGTGTTTDSSTTGGTTTDNTTTN